MPFSGMFRRVALVRTLFLHSLRRLLVTANVVPSSILVTLIIQALNSSETSVLTRVTLCNFPEHCILQSPRREILKSYTTLHLLYF
jgi:hypothetical protein